jgi:hypothetical protein
VSLITGYRALLIIVAGLYGLAFLTGRRHLRTPEIAAAEPALTPSVASPAAT